MNNLLNIIIPIFNASSTIRRTVNSLRVISNQNRGEIFLWCVDDGSTDNSVETFVEAISAIPGIQYNLIQKENGGSSSARNLALKSIEDGWVLFLDADDELVCDPVPFVKENPDKSALVFAVKYYNKEKPRHTIPGRSIDWKKVGTIFSSGNKYAIPSIITRRANIRNLFDESLLFVEDWHFWSVNPDVFRSIKVFPKIVISKIHGDETCKSADQYNNGQYRIEAAEKIGKFYGEKMGTIGKNNIRVQKEIGKKQMGEKMNPASFLWLPMSFVLFLKLIIYFFFFGIYQRTYQYK